MLNPSMETFFYLFTFPFIAAVIHYFYTNCLGCKLTNKYSIIAIYAIYCLISGSIYLASFFGNYSGLLNILLIIGLSFFYKSNLKWRIGAVSFILAIIVLSDVLVQSFLIAITTHYSSTVYIVSLFLSKFVTLILAYIAAQLCTSYSEGNLAGWYWVFLLFCPTVSFVGLYSLTHYIFIGNHPWLYPTLTIVLLFINFFVFILCDRLLRLKLIQDQNILLEQQLNYYINQYMLAENAQKETLKFRHDFKNILIGLQAKLKNGEITGSKQIINDLLSNFKEKDDIANSGNLIIDSIINYKHQIANSFNIKFQLNLQIPADIELNSTATSVILGNSLDNAIEACQHNTENNRYIKLKMNHQNDSLFMLIENPYTNEIQTNITGKILSSKLNYKSVGIGLTSVKDMVNKLNGLLNIDYNNNLFRVETILFNIGRGK